MFKAKSLNNSIRCILNCVLLNMFNLRRVTNNFKRFCPEFSPLSIINRIDTLLIDTPSMFHILFYGKIYNVYNVSKVAFAFSYDVF